MLRNQDNAYPSSAENDRRNILLPVIVISIICIIFTIIILILSHKHSQSQKSAADDNTDFKENITNDHFQESRLKSKEIIFGDSKFDLSKAESATIELVPVINESCHISRVNKLQFFQNCERLISCSNDGTIRVWDIRDLNNIKCIHTKWYGSSAFYDFSFSPDYMYLAATTRSNCIVYNINSGESVVLSDDSTNFSHFFEVKFSRTGSYLAAANYNGRVLIFKTRDLLSKPLSRRYASDKLHYEYQRIDTTTIDDPLVSISFSKDHLLAAVKSGKIKLYKTSDEFTLSSEIDTQSPIIKASFSNDGKYIIAAHPNKRIALYSARGNYIKEFGLHFDNPMNLDFSIDNKSVMIGYDNNGSVALFAFPDGGKIKQFRCKGDEITAIAVGSKGADLLYSASCSPNSIIYIWDDEGRGYQISSNGSISKTVYLSYDHKLDITGSNVSDQNGELNDSSRVFDLEKFKYIKMPRYTIKKSGTDAFNEYSFSKSFIIEESIKLIPSPTDFLVINQNEKPMSVIFRGLLNGLKHTCYTFFSYNLIASGGEDGTIEVYNYNGVKIAKLKGHTGKILSLSSAGDDKYLVSSSEDQTIKIWKIADIKKFGGKKSSAIDFSEFKKFGYSNEQIETLKESFYEKMLQNELEEKGWHNYIKGLLSTKTISPIYTLYASNPDEWLAWTDDGFFTGSSSIAFNSLGFYIYSMENYNRWQNLSSSLLFDLLYKPNLIKARFKNPYQIPPPSKAFSEYLREAFINSPPPEVEILHPRNNDAIESDKLSLKLKISDKGGGIGDIRIYQNGKLIESSGIYRLKSTDEESDGSYKKERSTAGRQTVYTGAIIRDFQIDLISGKNTIGIQSLDGRNKYASPFTEVNVISNVPAKRPNLYLMGIACENFTNSDLNVPGTHNNVKTILSDLKRYAPKDYGKIEKIELLDPDKKTVDNAFLKLANEVTPDDTFILSVSTHGSLESKVYYIILANFDKDYSKDSTITHYELMEYLKKIKALKQIIFLETCFSGSIELTLRDIYEHYIGNLSFNSGIHIIAASQPQDYAYVGIHGSNYGFFSYLVSDGLEGEADLDNNKKVSLKELSDYLMQVVTSESWGFQMPFINSYGKDIVLSIRK